MFVYTRGPKPPHQCQSLPDPEQHPKDTLSKDNLEQDNLDVPIALRKGVRTCTQHPIANYVNYERLSDQYKESTIKIDKVDIPKDIKSALRVPEWKTAVLEEMKALTSNNTWDIVVLPEGKKVVGCKWVFTVKYKSDGGIERYKARLVAQGYTQTFGVDYEETFALVAKLNSIRVLLSLAANLDWELHQMDVKNAFLNGELEEEIYMKIPPGFEREESEKKSL